MTDGGQWQQGEWQQGGWQQPWQQPYGPPAYGPGWPQTPPVWPHGPGRPGLATASAVLGIVTGSLTLIGGLIFLIVSLDGDGDGDLATWLLALGLPIGIALLVGGIGLLNRRQADLVLWSAVAAAAVVLLAMVGGAVTLSGDDADGVLGFCLFALPLPVVTACLAGQRVVRGWVAADAVRH